jgi:hypothetical protein
LHFESKCFSISIKPASSCKPSAIAPYHCALCLNFQHCNCSTLQCINKPSQNTVTTVHNMLCSKPTVAPAD